MIKAEPDVVILKDKWVFGKMQAFVASLSAKLAQVLWMLMESWSRSRIRIPHGLGQQEEKLSWKPNVKWGFLEG